MSVLAQGATTDAARPASPGGRADADTDAPAVAATLPHDLSPMGMVRDADSVVKAVLALLGVASLATWTLWLAKSIELAGGKSRIRAGSTILARSSSLAEVNDALAGKRSPVAAFASAALAEASRSVGLPSEGVKDRAAAVVGRIEARAARKMSVGTGILGTIGSTAPFVGLFGTVWGVMNSFVGISKANTTNLAVVAPGIAEALLATAVGLVAAIPAVVIYNLFARSIAAYRAMLSDAATDVLRHLSRDLDRAALPPSKEEG